LIDLALRGGDVSFRTVSGNWLRVELHDLKIHSDGADQPAAIALDGAYNNLRAKLIAEAQSFDVMRDPSHPYGIAFSSANASTAVQFKGTLVDPVNFDGVQGSIKIEAQKLGDLLQILGAESSINPPLQLGGDLSRHGNHWLVSDVGESSPATLSAGRWCWRKLAEVKRTT
jgi:AsmA family protein